MHKFPLSEEELAMGHTRLMQLRKYLFLSRFPEHRRVVRELTQSRSNRFRRLALLGPSPFLRLPTRRPHAQGTGFDVEV